MKTVRHRDGIGRRMLLALPAAAVLAAMIGPASAGATPATAGALEPAAGPTAPGFIMSDGRICDPIRHIGC